MWFKLKDTQEGIYSRLNVLKSYPTQMSKMFDPTDEETAISPRPFRATITDVIKSGIEVPAARKVKPITYK